MATYTQNYHHIVFATKNRVPVLEKARRDDFYRFVWSLLKNRACHLYQIGGVEDHVHILTSLHPAIALADLVKEIKTASSAWIKGERVFPKFDYWQEGYGAFTHSIQEKQRLVAYIKGQEEHHRQRDFISELKDLVEQAGLTWKPDYLP